MDKPLKEVQIALALAVRDGRLLMIQRKDSEPQWDKKWEIPGGKIDQGEHPHEAMCREVKEETSLDVLAWDFLGNYSHDWDLEERVLRVHMHIFKCAVSDGEVICEQGKAYQAHWVEPSRALEYDNLKANDLLIRRFLLNQTI